MSFGTDRCLSIFGAVYATGALVFPIGASVLEIGCAEADWSTPMLAERPDLHITGIDWRDAMGAGTIVRGDVLTHDFPAASFAAVVGISSIEHLGLGHYDNDPLDTDGDRHSLERAMRWLQPGGWVYADVPYDASGFAVVGTSHRVYDEAALQARLLVPGLRLLRRWYSQGQPGDLSETADPAPRDMQYVALLMGKES